MGRRNPAPELSADWPLWGGSARLVVRPAHGDETVGAAGVADVLKAARAEVDAVIVSVDAACSRFRADSEVMRLASAGGAAQPVSDVLADALAVALRAARLTDGAVDPTLGHALVAVGYDRDISQLPGDRPGAAVPPVVRRTAGWRDVQLDLERRTVTVPDGVLLDLGATAKAFAADRAADRAHRATGLPVLVALAGDIAVAGTRAGEPWPVMVVERPTETTGPVVEIHDGGIATSTTRARRWALSGRPMHHLLDPVTGLPVREVWRTVTVAAATCVDANTATTATVVKGDAGLEWLRSTGLPARLVAADGSVVGLGGWPADALEVTT